MNANEILTYIASKIAPDSFEDDKEIPNGKVCIIHQIWELLLVSLTIEYIIGH